MTRHHIILSIVCALCYVHVSAQSVNWEEFVSLTNQLTVNSEEAEFSPQFWLDNIIYIAPDSRSKNIDNNLGHHYFDIYVAELLDYNILSQKKFSTKINSDYHEGPVSFNSAGTSILFTSNIQQDNLLSINKSKLAILNIYQSDYIDGEWSDPVLWKLSDIEYPSCHPSINSTDSLIVYAGDLANSHGKMDLYMTQLTHDGWSDSQNLGPLINNKSNQWFPFIFEEKYLFYASQDEDTGLDIYYTNLDSLDNSPTKLPAPFNTEYDDFGFILDESGKNGFMTSNRPGGVGKDDIYSFQSRHNLLALLDNNYNRITFNIVNEDIADELITIKYRSVSESEIASFNQDLFNFDGSISYDSIVSGLKEVSIQLFSGYTSVEVSTPSKQPWQLVMASKGATDNIKVILKDFATAQKPITDTLYLEVEKIVEVEKEVPITNDRLSEKNLTKGNTIVLENIYYDYNDYTLTKSAKSELLKLVDVLTHNPSIRIELSAHTDSRGDNNYNLQLSKRRATEAKNFLISKGIYPDRIIARGYGETQLRNHCNDGTNCSESEHIYNRRTEIKVLDR